MHRDVSRFNSPKAKLNYPCSIPGEGHSGVCPHATELSVERVPEPLFCLEGYIVWLGVQIRIRLTCATLWGWSRLARSLFGKCR